MAAAAIYYMTYVVVAAATTNIATDLNKIQRTRVDPNRRNVDIYKENDI